MGQNISDVDDMRLVIYPGYQPILIASDVKNRASPVNISAAKSFPHIREIFPVSILSSGIPSVERGFAVRMYLAKLSKLSIRNNSHFVFSLA
ncbi:MAG: hypothetical protein JMDDDDMK_05723 [Acidobacteria bacterium]|nr:hypothetical protein [Acidobacteriota bacterium]